MKKIITLSLILLSATAITITSCKKSKVQGCMDKLSINYNSSAEEDDGSCKYVGKATFFVDDTSANYYANHGIGKLKITLSATNVGTYNLATGIPTAQPTTCDPSGYLSTTLSMGSDKVTNGVVYTVTDSIGGLLNSGTVNLQAGVCKFVRITHD